MNNITFSKLGSYGHLGNQLFQFSLLYSYSKIKNKNIIFTDDKKNTMLFNCFNLKCNINFTKHINPSSKYIENKFSYNSNIWNNDFEDFCGYFQTEKYFKNYKEELHEIIEFKESDIDLNDYIFIHVRRNDYLKFPNIHPICSEDYYTQSINIMKEKYGSAIKFIVFSDDIEGAKLYKCFNQDNIYFSNNSSFLSLYQMTTCMSGILANSSFSWWGGWLIKNKNKTIIAPSKWFGEDGPKDWYDIYADDWKII